MRRVGATATRKVDVQIIAATNRDLEAAVRLGEFREDLYQRLRVAVIRIPPLREREGDAVLLARTFLAEACRRYGVPPRQLSAEAEAAIARYAWPGNVRELANTMERVVLFSDNDPVPAEDLGLSIHAAAVAAHRAEPRAARSTIDFPKPGPVAGSGRAGAAHARPRRRPPAIRAPRPGCSASRATRCAIAWRSSGSTRPDPDCRIPDLFVAVVGRALSGDAARAGPARNTATLHAPANHSPWRA